ncbi:hypothetical protein [Bifidobacterium choerinum]|uniref:Uncharacterized protein n=1 Tax=Bifidobacterium choerinum TaxID=35760 RepID=A0A2D3D4F4_9BIFI|nr:hypothetical protein [Bifidobacterium choerinum]ATU20007.1 hypothetical protein BcFMB_02635 [Bifidobacterium choerinum]
MAPSFDERRRSWGLYVWNSNGDGDGRFIRVLDYVTDAAGHGRYEWVMHARWWDRPTNPNADDPKTFYRREFRRVMADSPSDFRFLQWTPCLDRPDHPTVNFFQSGLHATEPPLYEIIDTPAQSAEELPHILTRGFQYSGYPTEKILLLFAGSGDSSDAAVLKRDMVTIHNGMLTLNEGAPHSVPQVKLKNRNIHIIHGWHGNGQRYVYDQPTLPPSNSSVLIKTLQELAQAYMQWYIRKERLRNSNEYMHSAGAILEQAFSKPENLNEYLDVSPSSQDLCRLQTALKATIRSNTDDISAIIYDLLKQDDDVMTAFRQQATVALEDEFNVHKRKLRTQLDDLREQRKQQTKTVQQLTQQVRELDEQLQQKQRAIRDMQAELELQEEVQQQSLQELEENVALKLGLQQIVRHNDAMLQQMASQRAASTDANERLRSAPMMAQTSVHAADDARHALAQNLQALGCAFTTKRSRNSKCLTDFAMQLCRTLQTTRLLAVDSVHVPAVANALAFALAGVPAQHMGMPVDFSDFSALETFLKESASPVIVLDNVFDTVNESLLFALNRCNPGDAIVVLPIGSLANLRLVAPEVWQRIFFVPTAGMIELPVSHTPTLYKAVQPLTHEDADTDTVVAQLSALQPTASLTATAMVTPATIMAFGHGMTAAREWVMPHLCVEMYAYNGFEAADALCRHRSNATIADKLVALINRIDHGSPAC